MFTLRMSRLSHPVDSYSPELSACPLPIVACQAGCVPSHGISSKVTKSAVFSGLSSRHPTIEPPVVPDSERIDTACGTQRVNRAHCDQLVRLQTPNLPICPVLIFEAAILKVYGAIRLTRPVTVVGLRSVVLPDWGGINGSRCRSWRLITAAIPLPTVKCR